MSGPTNTYDEALTLVPADAAGIYNTIITSLEQGVGEPLYPGDERRIFGEALTAVFVSLYNSINDAARQTLLRYARGQVLDAIGELMDVHRLEGDKASTVLRFSVSAPLANNLIIPQGTKVTPDSSCYFLTDETAVLQAGSYFVNVSASAAEVGAKHNGYTPGTITTLVDLLPYLESVTNLTETAGGDDGEPYTSEGDDRLRSRIRLAPSRFSTAGPELAYIYWTMTADSSIIDAKAISETETVKKTLAVYGGRAFMGGASFRPGTLVVKAPGSQVVAQPGVDYAADYTDDLLTITLAGALENASGIEVEITRTMEGCVKIVPLLEGGRIPDEAVLQKVYETVNARDVRPLTDKVSVVPPEAVLYDVELVYYAVPRSEAEAVTNIEGTNGAIDRYNRWQTEALGRDINPDQLRRLILSPDWGENLTGAIRVEVVKPVYQELNDTQVAQFSGNLSVRHQAATGVI